MPQDILLSFNDAIVKYKWINQKDKYRRLKY